MEVDAGVLGMAVRCSGVCRMVEVVSALDRSGGGGRGKMMLGGSFCLRSVTSLVGILSSIDW